MEYKQVMPNAVDLEEAILGALLLEPHYVPKIELILPTDSFYRPNNKTVYIAILSLKNAKENIDLLTVIEFIRKSDKLKIENLVDYVIDLTNRVTSAANIETHARIVFQKYVNRVLIEMANKINVDAYEDVIDPLELLYRSQKDLIGIVEKIVGQKQVEMRNVYYKAINDISERFMNRDKIQFYGNPTGFKKFDRLVGGRKKSEFVVVAARPSMGKTTFTLQEVISMTVQFKIPVCYFSIEMSSHQLIVKAAANLANVNSENIERGNMTDNQYDAVVEKLTNLMDDNMLIIDDGTAPTITEIKTKAALYKEKYGIQAIYIDYLQLIKPTEKGRTRDQEIDEIGRGLKELAKDLDIPVIALSQLSREVEKRADKIPMLSDLRDGGNIEGHADVVNFLYRPEYYGMMVDGNGNDLRGITMIVTAKNRNGKVGKNYFKFNMEVSNFYELSDELERDIISSSEKSPNKKYDKSNGDYNSSKNSNNNDPF